jgi:dTDP-4-amino-4,6-dideoxygalactose transaminase
MNAATVSIMLNDFVAQWQEVRADTLAAVDRVGASGWLILGKEVKEFEAALGSFWGLAHAVGCGNGLDAIEISLRALGLRAGDRVLTTPLSAFATTLAIVRAGGAPVFVDVDGSGLVDLSLCRKLLKSRPDIRFFVPVHLYGHGLDVDQLADLKRFHNLRIVEDCAQSIGAQSHGVLVGAVGEFAATSFYPTKNLGAMGDGGAVLTADPTLADIARSLRDYGQAQKYVHSRLGLNSRLDELQASILRTALLPRLKRFTERRQAIAAAYVGGIRHAHISLPSSPCGSTSVWHLFPVIVSDRERFVAHLNANSVGCGVHYPKLITDQEALRGVPHEVIGPLDSARRFAAGEVSLPIHPYLDDEQVARVISVCNEWRS